MKIGDMVKFVDGKIIGLVVGTTNAPDVVQIFWLRANTPHLAQIKNLEVISEGR